MLSIMICNAENRYQPVSGKEIVIKGFAVYEFVQFFSWRSLPGGDGRLSKGEYNHRCIAVRHFQKFSAFFMIKKTYYHRAKSHLVGFQAEILCCQSKIKHVPVGKGGCFFSFFTAGNPFLRARNYQNTGSKGAFARRVGFRIGFHQLFLEGRVTYNDEFPYLGVGPRRSPAGCFKQLANLFIGNFLLCEFSDTSPCQNSFVQFHYKSPLSKK